MEQKYFIIYIFWSHFLGDNISTKKIPTHFFTEIIDRHSPALCKNLWLHQYIFDPGSYNFFVCLYYSIIIHIIKFVGVILLHPVYSYVFGFYTLLNLPIVKINRIRTILFFLFARFQKPFWNRISLNQSISNKDVSYSSPN